MKKFNNVADGRQTQENPPNNIYEAMGIKKERDKYNTNSVAEYKSSLVSMNMADLQRHSISVGIKPNTDRNHLIARLVREFNIRNSSYRSAYKPRDPEQVEKGEQILRELGM